MSQPDPAKVTQPGMARRRAAPPPVPTPTAAERRRAAILSVARAAFLADGYAGTTMSSIAARVGGSKTTLWTYFPAKETLFEAVLDDIAREYGATLRAEMPADAPPAAVLHRFGRVVLTSMLSPTVIALHRLVVAEAVRFPNVAHAYHSRGPGEIRARLAAYLGGQMARGTIRPGDPMVAAQQFGALFLGGSFNLVLLGILTDLPGPEAIEAEVQAVLRTFMGAWGAEDRAGQGGRPGVQPSQATISP